LTPLPARAMTSIPEDECMAGGIYTEEKCPVCGARFRHIEPRGVFCPIHPKVSPQRYRVLFKGAHRRFHSYRKALRFLTGLRHRMDEGDYDARDFRRAKPLAADNLLAKWIEVKRTQVKPGSWKNLRLYTGRASDHWGDRNVKEITAGEIQDFLMAQEVSSKTRANMRSALSDFFSWLEERGDLRPDQVPKLPRIKFELGWRKTVGRETQERILSEIKRATWDHNPKIFLGVRWLCVYVAIRPGDLLRIRERDIDLEVGVIILEHPTKSRGPKYVPLLAEDLEAVRAIPRGLPDLLFFRHTRGKAITPGEPFGEKLLYKHWKAACAALGIEGVDLYGGTRHSSVRALRKHRTPEEIKRATMHQTNAAFERYYQMETEDLRDIFADSGKGLAKDSESAEKGKLLKFKE
jgi:integrase